MKNDKVSKGPSGRAERNKWAGVRPYLFWSCAVVAIMIASLLRCGRYLLISDDVLHVRVDGAVVLQGSILGEQARVAGAVRLLQQGAAARMLLSVPKESYWGQPIAPIAHSYVAKLYGKDTADRTDFCESGSEVDSTDQESRVLANCIRERGWTSVAVVTSDYHTRRTKIIWRRMLQQQHSPVHLWVYAVADPEFHASRWWRERRSAKTWILESTKLLWTLAGR